MSDYNSRYTGAQVDSLLDAINSVLVAPFNVAGANAPELIGYRYAGVATPATNPITTTKVFYLAKTPGTYTNFGGLVLTQGEVVAIRKNDSNIWVKEGISSLFTFYAECTTVGGTATKELTINNYDLSTSVRFIVKFTHANTIPNAALSINQANPIPLYYRGVRASNTNTWKDGEVLDIYYDGTNYYANPVYVEIAQTTGQDPNAVMSQKAVTDELDDLKAAVWPLVPTFTINMSSPQEYTGNAITPILTWGLTRKGVAKNPHTVIIRQGGSPIENLTDPGVATGTKQASVNQLGTTNFSLEMSADNLTTTKDLSLTQVLPCFVGFYATGASVAIMKDSLIKKLVTRVEDLSGTYTNYTTGYSLTICIPADMSIDVIYSSMFEVPMLAPVTDTSLSIGGQARTYKVYRSASETGINAGDMVIDVRS